MAKSSTSTALGNTAPPSGRADRLLREARWILLAALATYLFLILATYNPLDPGWSQDVGSTTLANRGGRWGAYLADILLYIFGISAYWWVILVLSRVARGYRELLRMRLLPNAAIPSDPVWIAFLGFAVLLVASTGLEFLRFYSLTWALPNRPGGILGSSVGIMLAHALGYSGATLALLVTWAIGFSLFTGVSWLTLAERVGAALEWVFVAARRRKEVQEDRRVGEVAATQREEIVVQERARAEEATQIHIEPQVVAVAQSARLAKEMQVPLFSEMLDSKLPPLALLVQAPERQETVGAETVEFTSRLIEKKAQGLRRSGSGGCGLSGSGHHAL